VVVVDGVVDVVVKIDDVVEVDDVVDDEEEVLVVEVDPVEVVELLVVEEVVVTGAENMANLLLPLSLTQTLPAESAVTLYGARRPFALVAAVENPKPCWPRTNDAPIPVEKGEENSTTREFPRSATHRLPFGSNVMPEGELSPA
jgi:hypothetical protein